VNRHNVRLFTIEGARYVKGLPLSDEAHKEGLRKGRGTRVFLDEISGKEDMSHIAQRDATLNHSLAGMRPDEEPITSDCGSDCLDGKHGR